MSLIDNVVNMMYFILDMAHTVYWSWSCFILHDSIQFLMIKGICTDALYAQGCHLTSGCLDRQSILLNQGCAPFRHPGDAAECDPGHKRAALLARRDWAQSCREDRFHWFQLSEYSQTDSCAKARALEKFVSEKGDLIGMTPAGPNDDPLCATG